MTFNVEIRCGQCHQWVCTGRPYLHGEDEIFVCHEECDAHGKAGKQPVAAFDTEQVPGALHALSGPPRPVAAIESKVMLALTRKT